MSNPLAILTKTKRRSKLLISEMKHTILVQTDIIRMREYSPNSIYIVQQLWWNGTMPQKVQATTTHQIGKKLLESSKN